MKFFNKYIHKYWKLFCIAVACLTVEAGCDLMQPTIMSKIIDVGVAGKNMDYILKMGGVMLFVTLVGATSAVSRNIISSNVSQKFGTELRYDLFEKIQNLSSWKQFLAFWLLDFHTCHFRFAVYLGKYDEHG